MSRRLIFLCVFVLVAAALLFGPVPFPPTYAGRTLENAGHTPLFLIATLSILFVLRHDLRVDGARLYVIAGLIAIAAAGLSEVIQEPFQRDASWDDVFADAIGVVCGLALFALFDRRAALGKIARVAALSLALVCIAMYLDPIVSMTRAYLQRNGQFPVLADFSSMTDIRWVVGYGVNRDFVRGALAVDFESDEFPGVSLYEPVPDWRGMKTLVIDLENPEVAPLDLGVRVHDRGHGKSYFERFNRNYLLAPTERREIRIALEDIRHAPRGRLMDMGHIADITVFRNGPTGSRRLRIYTMRLE